MRDSFVMYKSTVEAVKTFSEKQRLKFYEAIFEYVFNDNEPQDLNSVLQSFFNLLKPLIDSNNKKYQNGCKGGRPQNNSDTSPLKKLDYAEDVILTENQYEKLKDKYGERLLQYAIEEVQEWLEYGKSGNPNAKKARAALGCNHYSYFNVTGWAITNGKNRIEEEQKNSQPNWSI